VKISDNGDNESDSVKIDMDSVKDSNHLEQSNMQTSVAKSGRKPGTITNCPHTHLKHFAKGMCNHCYHRFGRDGNATKCGHKDRRNYAKGMCQNCYINTYNKIKRLAKKEKKL
jgi:hypothetical protein